MTQNIKLIYFIEANTKMTPLMTGPIEKMIVVRNINYLLSANDVTLLIHFHHRYLHDTIIKKFIFH